MNADTFSILYVIPFLVYATHFDIRTREVPNKVWSWMFIFALPLIAYNLMTMDSGGRIAFSVTVVSAIILCGILLYSEYFAGADFKCLVLLSVIMPAYAFMVIVLSVVMSLCVTATDMTLRWSTMARKQPYLVNVLLSVLIILMVW